MKIALQDVPPLLVNHMEKNILPKANMYQKFVVGAAMFALSNRASAAINDPKVVSNMKMLGVLGDDGFVDMDYAREMAISALQRTGGSLPIGGYVFDAQDVEALYENAKSVKAGE